MIKLKLKIEEIDAVLTALGDQPYVKVAELVVKIRQQALPQYESLKEQENILDDETEKVSE